MFLYKLHLNAHICHNEKKICVCFAKCASYAVLMNIICSVLSEKYMYSSLRFIWALRNNRTNLCLKEIKNIEFIICAIEIRNQQWRIHTNVLLAQKSFFQSVCDSPLKSKVIVLVFIFRVFHIQRRFLTLKTRFTFLSSLWLGSLFIYQFSLLINRYINNNKKKKFRQSTQQQPTTPTKALKSLILYSMLFRAIHRLVMANFISCVEKRNKREYVSNVIK